MPALDGSTGLVTICVENAGAPFREAGHPNRGARGGAISILGLEPKKWPIGPYTPYVR
jgi:hypothetical protein